MKVLANIELLLSPLQYVHAAGKRSRSPWYCVDTRAICHGCAEIEWSMHWGEREGLL